MVSMAKNLKHRHRQHSNTNSQQRKVHSQLKAGEKGKKVDYKRSKTISMHYVQSKRIVMQLNQIYSERVFWLLCLKGGRVYV